MKILFNTPNDKVCELELDEDLLQISVIPTEDSFLSMLISGYADIFDHGYIGYWSRGVKFYENKNTWLCYEMPIEESFSIEEMDNAAIKAYDCLKRTDHLPLFGDDPHEKFNLDLSDLGVGKLICFVIDKKLACKAIVEAFKKWGQQSIDNWDANTVDYGIQMALYNEIMWG